MTNEEAQKFKERKQDYGLSRCEIWLDRETLIKLDTMLKTYHYDPHRREKTDGRQAIFTLAIEKLFCDINGKRKRSVKHEQQHVLVAREVSFLRSKGESFDEIATTFNKRRGLCARLGFAEREAWTTASLKNLRKEYAESNVPMK